MILSDFIYKSTNGPDGGNLENEKPACGYSYLRKKDWKEAKEKSTTYALNILDELKRFMNSAAISNSF